MKRLGVLHWLIYPLFILGCAKTTSPTGGPKDTIPPVLIKSIPEKGSINFKGKEIQLVFSENVALKNQKEQIIITPNLAKEYKIQSSKKTISITLEDELKDSTTYTFSFRDAIVDLNESNPARNLKLAFSTGAYIDSLIIAGSVFDLLKSKELKDLTVALYESDTFDIFKHKAVYITKSDAKGKFQIENLKPGKYYLYALDDRSRNLIVDSKSEAYGFLADSIVLDANVKNATLPIIKLDARKLKVSGARPYNSYFNIKATKSIVKYKITSEDIIPYSTLGDDKASIKVYNTLLEKDSASINLNITDSIGNSIDTLLYIKFNKQNVKPEKFDVTAKDFRLIENKGLITGTLKFTKPIFQINFDSILFKIDSTKAIQFLKEDITIDSIASIAYVEKKIDKTLLIKEPPPANTPPPTTKVRDLETNKNNDLKEANGKPKATPKQPKKNIENQLFIGKASFISIESDSSKRIEETIKITKLDQTGIIFVTIETQEQNFIVELIRKDYSLVTSIYNQKKISFEDLVPGDYMIRLVIDHDKNKKWTPGNFYLRQEPENCIFYKNEKGVSLINLRANFELGPLLIKY